MKFVDAAIKKYYVENEITVPKFSTWARLVYEKYDEQALQQALEHAYAKGLSLGYQAGYKDAKDEWWQEQDKEASKIIRDTSDGQKN